MKKNDISEKSTNVRCLHYIASLLVPFLTRLPVATVDLSMLKAKHLFKPRGRVI